MTYPAYSNLGNWGQGVQGIANPVIPQQNSFSPQSVPAVQPSVAQIQNGGLVVVPGEDDVLNYPLAPGYSVAFVDSNFTHLWIKTTGFTQLEPPKCDKYLLTKETNTQKNSLESESEIPEYATKSDIDRLWTEVKKLRNKGSDGK